MSFFDEQENSVGMLSARLGADASSVQGATGKYLYRRNK
jgi:hypothetical protein